MLNFLFFLFVVFQNFTLLGQISHYVEVGGSGIGGGAYYFPQHININIGDTVIWQNVQGTHNVDGSLQTFPNNPEGFFSSTPQGAPWTYSFVFTLPGVYDYECNQGNHNITQFGSVTVSVPLGVNSSVLECCYVDNNILYLDNIFTPISFKIYNINGQLIYDFKNYSEKEFDLNKIKNSGLYILYFLNEKQKLITNSIFIK